MSVITRSAREHALAGERIFHPLARPPRRQRLFPSGQFVEFVSPNLQVSMLLIIDKPR
jgi:hypothetical protein